MRARSRGKTVCVKSPAKVSRKTAIGSSSTANRLRLLNRYLYFRLSSLRRQDDDDDDDVCVFAAINSFPPKSCVCVYFDVVYTLLPYVYVPYELRIVCTPYRM